MVHLNNVEKLEHTELPLREATALALLLVPALGFSRANKFFANPTAGKLSQDLNASRVHSANNMVQIELWHDPDVAR
eukprot:CAMPEP_0205829308 /NCGR_PEP_ID=MMETSP0206-20130828/37776_1 /ASSEMBLY_ACC=CAM_ASM_000279 /TAXON_ID=36767 /ORGANISM="Euplotes focardii, Strain TN1" /LENGTH=76 /DNA_ID=CAMNT_0053131939 /DNA_START=46 /DNA_END=277 /DNA_ORIENTATION=-